MTSIEILLGVVVAVFTVSAGVLFYMLATAPVDPVWANGNEKLIELEKVSTDE